MDGDADPGGARTPTCSSPRPITTTRIVKNHLSLKTLEAHLARDQRQAADPHPYERRHARTAGRAALPRRRRRHGRRALGMHSPAPPSKVTTAQVFAIAGPAMVANLTTPLIGIVSTTAIGRLGDATLLGGVAMASVIFDCLFWLFGFLRMSTVAFTAQSLGAGETSELRAILVRGLDRRGADRRRPDRAADAAGDRPARRDGRQRRRHACRQDLFHHPDLVGAAGARQLRRARLADRTGARHAGARRRRSRSTSSTWWRRCCWCWSSISASPARRSPP